MTAASNTTALTPARQLAANIDRMKPQFAQALPPNVSVDRFTRVVLHAIQTDPALLEADRQSLYNACVQAAMDGLMPDGRMGKIVVYNVKEGDRWMKKAQWQRMVGGIRHIAAKYGVTIDAQVVHAGDEFSYVLGDNPRIEHMPAFGNRGEIVAAYAIATLKDGTKLREVMSRDEIDKVAAVSKSRDKNGNAVGPWRDWFGEQARKTVVKRLFKALPLYDMDERDAQVIERDNEEYDLSILDEPAPAAQAPKSGRPSVLDKVAGKGKSAAAPPPQDDTPPLADEDGVVIEHGTEVDF